MSPILLKLGAFASSVIIACVVAPLLIPFLRRIKFGQAIITDYGPTWHKSKQGTPTMGGFVFIISTVIAYFIFAIPFYIKGSDAARWLPSPGLVCVIVSLMFALLGFADDFIKIRKKHNQGLTEIQKLIMQLVISSAFILFDSIRTGGRTSVQIPFTNIQLELGIFYYILAMVVMVGFTNAVNLTDGIDGLATSVTLPVSIFFVFAATSIGADDVAVVAAALAGGCVGFLVFNWHPAKVFMGDTGSLFLGGMVATFAFSINQPLIILIAGIVYLIEAFSVMIQVAYFKITHGKRLFKMTPIHHSFELSGWSEEKIVLTFTAASAVGCLVAVVASMLV
ncbi:MAG: phospho-N-acetylmuramoyl-pentapeptide-transferase [Eubacteriales bacterium]